MDSSADEALAGHLKAGHCAIISRAVCQDVSILVIFVQIPLVKVTFQGTGQFEQVDGLGCVVQNHNIRSLSSDTDLGRYSATSSSLVSLQVTVHCVLGGVNT